MSQNFEEIDKMPLKHLPNDAKLHIQRQKAPFIPEDTVQLYFATSFKNAENNERVWNKGFSIQLESIPAMIELLKKVQQQYAGPTDTGRTGTFADLAE